MVEFGILGPIEVVVAGEPMTLGGPRQRAVLARLLLDGGRVVAAERLIEDVWDGQPPATAGKTLQKYVSELRRILPADMLRTAGGGYLLEVEPDRLDARRFERLVANGEYDDGLALWRGDVLADLADLSFVAPERARLEELRLFAIESGLEGQLDSGHHAAAIGPLTELVDEHPLRERLTSLLMLALYRSGRQVEALRVFERHRQFLADEVGVEPAAELRQLEAAILRHDPALDAEPPQTSGRRPAGNMPTTMSSFIGREHELDSVARAIGDNRLVTLTGPGGIGKTRLAQEVGARLGDRFPAGVWMVDLAPVHDPDLVPLAIATAMAIDTRHAPDELTALNAALSHRATCLVVLDNCEHIVESVAATTVAVLGAARHARVLATSRRPLGVDGEFVRPIQPLADAESARLFADRARLTADAPDVSVEQAFEICRQLDGLPLAIELAASQLRVMNPDEIIARLEDQLVFRGPTSTASPRQRTLGEMVQWSYELLAPPVQSSFARLGVFASSFTLAAAEAVCSSASISPRQVIDHLTTLIDHSLLVRDESLSGSSRYRLLETLRLFAVERLAESGELESAHRAHAEFFRALAAEGGAHMYGPEERAWRARLELEEPNLHAALRWADGHDPVFGLRLAVDLWPYWDARWRERQGVEYIDDLLRLDVPYPADLRAWALTASAAMSGNAGEARRTVPKAIEAVAAQRAIGDEHGLAQALAALGLALGNQGQLDEAELVLDEGLAIARRLDDGVAIARLLDRLGFIAGRRGDHARAAEINREELAILSGLGSRRGEATAQRHLAVSLHHLGDDDEAALLCRRALAIWNDLDDPASIAHVLTTVADIARISGDLAGAAETYEKALVDLRAIGDRRCTASTYKNLATVAAAQGDPTGASRLYLDALVLRHELGDEAGLAEVLEGMAHVASGDGRDLDAATLLACANTLRERSGSVPSPRDVGRLDGTLAACRERIGEAAVAARFEQAAQMPVAEVVELALLSGRSVEATADLAG